MMDFVIGLSRMTMGYDIVWFIVDRFTKLAWFVPIRTIKIGESNLALYIVDCYATWDS